MKLQFDTYKKNHYFGINVWYRTDEGFSQENGREYLTEEQYSTIAKWCETTFNTQEYKLRARRMSYADFWFTSKRDVDWFLLHWSGIDSENI